MLPEYFAFIGATTMSLGGAYYLLQTLRGKTKPNRMTWLLWGLFPLITFVAQRSQGVEEQSWVIFASAALPLLIFVASFLNKKAYWHTQKRDYFLMIAALIGIALWAVTSDANIAILFAIIADFLAGVPTFIKAYKQPRTESWVAYALNSIGNGIAVLAIHDLTFQNAAFITYLFSANLVLTTLARRHPRKKRRKH